MPGWLAILILPNVELRVAIECGGIAALAPPNDVRVVDAARTQPGLLDFLGRFSNAFGDRVSPTVMLVSEEAHERYRSVEAVAALRDLVCISVVPKARAAFLRKQGSGLLGIVYSDAFSIYPWMVEPAGGYLYCQTPAFSARQIIDRFGGQASALVDTKLLSDEDLDTVLFDALLNAWRRRFSEKRVGWIDRAVFRSLNMATSASLVPGSTETTFYDVGRSLSLWISAFEILAHPRGYSVDVKTVCDLIDQSEWELPELRRRVWKTYLGRGKYSRRGLASHLYGKMYTLRNDFSHGNYVKPSHLLTRGDRNISFYAAPLYRIALAARLKVKWSGRVPSLRNAKRFSRAVVRSMEFSDPQRDFEKALRTAVGPSRGELV